MKTRLLSFIGFIVVIGLAVLSLIRHSHVSAYTAPNIESSPSGGIAFVSNLSGQQDLYVINVNGTDRRRLTYLGNVNQPAWSPDGSRIAFASFSSYLASDGEIYVINADGTGLTRLTYNSAFDWHPTWSPDGTRIAFASYRDGNGEIYVMNADGSGQTRLTKNSLRDDEPVWAPGTRIAFFRVNSSSNWDIYTMNADGTGLTQLTRNASVNIHQDWSPSGQSIAFVSYRAGGVQIFVMDADGSNVTRLTNCPNYCWHPSWSPDGRQIAFVTQGDIYVMNADGTGMTNITNSLAEDDKDPDWSWTSLEHNIVFEARLDIGMPYNTDRGCSSPYIGCGGPYHGFYNGVCTDLAMDAYYAGVPFNIQNALYQDHLSHPGRYQYGTARNAEDMRRYFMYNQQLLLHNQSYLPGDIAFFNWNPDDDDLTNHVNVISEIDSNGRPLKMVDATGVYSGNPSGRAIEHSWNSYYERHVQAHGRLSSGRANFHSTPSKAETLQVLRIVVDSPAVALRLRDANGKFIADAYDENLVASNVEAFIPYIPGSMYVNLGSKKVISVTQPLSNAMHYLIELTSEASAQYDLRIQTFQNGRITSSSSYTDSISPSETRAISLQLNAPGGVIGFVASPPVSMPKVRVMPGVIAISGLSGMLAQTAITVSETGGQEALNNVSISISDVMNQNGQVVARTLFTVAPASFTVPAGGGQSVRVEVDLANIQPGTYQGNLLITSTNVGSQLIPLSLAVRSFDVFLPIALRSAPQISHSAPNH